LTLKKNYFKFIKELLVLLPIAFIIYLVYVFFSNNNANGIIYWGVIIGSLISRFFVIIYNT